MFHQQICTKKRLMIVKNVSILVQLSIIHGVILLHILPVLLPDYFGMPQYFVMSKLMNLKHICMYSINNLT